MRSVRVCAAAFCALMWGGAAGAAPASRALALKVLAWGLAAYGALLVVEAASGALIYRSLRQAIGDPIRPDLAIKNVAQGSEGIAPEDVRYLRVAEPVGWPYDNTRGGQRYGEDHRYGGPGPGRDPGHRGFPRCVSGWRGRSYPDLLRRAADAAQNLM